MFAIFYICSIFKFVYQHAFLILYSKAEYLYGVLQNYKNQISDEKLLDFTYNYLNYR